MNNITIVVPVHNKDMYIQRTLDSILNQTYLNFELILVNDGSSDNSGLICDQYALKDKRITVIHQKNAGVSAARNSGIKAAKNSLISFIDADDWWDPHFLEEMHRLISAFPNVALYSAKFSLVKNDKIILSEAYFNQNEEFIEFNLIEDFCYKARFPIHTSSAIINKEAIEKAGFFDERIKVYEDYDLFLRIALFSNVAYLNKSLLSFYNLDVSPESKARGRIPLLSTHWISYMDKFKTSTTNNKKLKLLLDRSILSQLILYRNKKKYKEEVKTLISQVDRENFSWKYRIIYNTHLMVGNSMLFIYKIFSQLKLKLQKYLLD